jgi:hypothetical protein
MLPMSAMRSCCHSCCGRRALANSSRDQQSSVSPLGWVWMGQNSKQQQAQSITMARLQVVNSLEPEDGYGQQWRPLDEQECTNDGCS